jgi:hypothetical protein
VVSWKSTTTAEQLPSDPFGDAVAEAVTDMLDAAVVELRYTPSTEERPGSPSDPACAAEVGPGPPGWNVTFIVRLNERVAGLVATTGGASHLAELLQVLPRAALATLDPFRQIELQHNPVVSPSIRRALRDTLAVEVLTAYLVDRIGKPVSTGLVADTVDFLVELSGTRLESHELTHGVVIADAFAHPPRLAFAYPTDVRTAKRAPLLFDGTRSVLVVDSQGRARTEVQRHRITPFVADRPLAVDDDTAMHDGWLVGEATRILGGVGLLARADRSIWTFVDGQPLLVRRGEHWSAFPLDLADSIEDMIGGGTVASLVTHAAFMIAARPGGAILAIVDESDQLESVVSAKDRFDLRDQIDPSAMRPETRLHHLIEAEQLDAQTLVRLAMLDGATVVDRDGRLLAYGAVVTSEDSQHEGARTAAARTLSESAAVVLKISADGDITVFRHGKTVTMLLGRATR